MYALLNSSDLSNNPGVLYTVFFKVSKYHVLFVEKQRGLPFLKSATYMVQLGKTMNSYENRVEKYFRNHQSST
jgi:hypothetical protein